MNSHASDPLQSLEFLCLSISDRLELLECLCYHYPLNKDFGLQVKHHIVLSDSDDGVGVRLRDEPHRLGKSTGKVTQ